jgi:hypothetical protein
VIYSTHRRPVIRGGTEANRQSGLALVYTCTGQTVDAPILSGPGLHVVDRDTSAVPHWLEEPRLSTLPIIPFPSVFSFFSDGLRR